MNNFQDLNQNNAFGQTSQQGDDPLMPAKQDNMISVGSPESPVTIDNGAATESQKPQEFGYEQLQKIENMSENALEAAERKEAKRPEDPRQNNFQSQQPPQPVAPIKKKPSPDSPKYFGYNIPPQIANNYKLIQSNAGKGDPASSQTWVYMLLDKLLKVRSVK